MIEQTQSGFDFAAKPRYLTRLEEDFEKFDREHPEVYRKFCQLAFQLIEARHRHYSADAICHVIRFHTDLRGDPRDEWKINNTHVAYLARKFAKDNPAYADFFRFRTAGR